MTKNRMMINHKVDVDKVKFAFSDSRLYEYSVKTSKSGKYIIREDDDYYVVDEETNSLYHWTCDLSELEENV